MPSETQLKELLKRCLKSVPAPCTKLRREIRAALASDTVADGMTVTATLMFVSPEGERQFHARGRCSGDLCPLKRKQNAHAK